MSAAWVIALGVAVGYLTQRKQVVQSRLDAAAAQFEGAAEPADGGITSAQLRTVVPNSDRGPRDYNDSLQKGSLNEIKQQHSSMQQHVQSWDSSRVVAAEPTPPPPSIQGVWMEPFA